MQGKSRIIAITGPESTGKSSLAKELAQHYLALRVEEVARTYLEGLGRAYTYDDILEIARRQHGAIERARSASTGSFLFLDTEFTVLRIWCEYVYGKCHPWILEKEQTQQVDLFLLTDIDLPWQPDPLREHPDKRHELFSLYHQALEKRDTPFIIVSGMGKSRLQAAIDGIEAQF